MTRRMDNMAGALSYKEYTDEQGEHTAGNVGPRQHSTLDATKRNVVKRKKRRQTEATKVQHDNYSSLPPAKKAKTDNPSSLNATLGHAAHAQDTAGICPFIRENHGEVEPYIPSGLMTSLLALYELHNMKVISSSKIQTKVSTIVETLGSFSFVAATKPNIVFLRAKAPVSSKLITIVEITKREIAKAGGKWYQYNSLGQTLAVQEKKSKAVKSTGFTLGGKIDVETHDMDLDDKDDSQSIEDDETIFGTMKTPLERAIEGKPKVQAIPLMAIFLSRIRIDALKIAYGLVNYFASVTNVRQRTVTIMLTLEWQRADKRLDLTIK